MEAIRSKRISQIARKSSKERETKPIIERFGSRSGTCNASITLGRFHPVALLPKLGVYVYGNLQIMDDEDAGELNLQKIYDSLWPSYVRYYELFHGCTPVKNYIENSNLQDAFSMMLALLSQMMGNYAQIDIVTDVIGKYYFVAYQDCFFTGEWQVFELKPTMEKLLKGNKIDLTNFLLFMRAFQSVGIESWFNGQMLYILDEQMDEEIECSEGDEETIESITNAVKLYREGLPAQVVKMINNSYTDINDIGESYVDIDKLETLNNKTKSDPIKKIITAGLALLRLKKSIMEYNYIPDQYEDQMGLSYDCQFTVVWDIDDILTGYYTDFIDCSANEGVFPPWQALRITPDCDHLFIPDNFTKLLSHFFDTAVEQMKIYTKPKPKKNAGHIE